jgi:hypothetical protein
MTNRDYDTASKGGREIFWRGFFAVPIKDFSFSPFLNSPKTSGEAEFHPDFEDQIGTERTNQGPGNYGPPRAWFDKSEKETHEKDGHDEKTKDGHQISVEGQSYEYKKDFVPADFFSQNIPQAPLPPSLPQRFQKERNRHRSQKDPEP